MTRKQRVLASMRFRQPDRVPRYWQNFWPKFIEKWQRRHGDTDPHEYLGDDMRLVASDETAWPSKAGVVERDGDTLLVRSGWGELKQTSSTHTRSREMMGRLIKPAFPERVDPETIEFDDPLMDIRYEQASQLAAEWKDDYFVFCKTGGPYLRAAFMRGEENFWTDVAEDPGWTRAFVDRVVDHIIIVGLEQLRRFDLYETGIAIYDDVASNAGPFVGPANYAKIFLPALRRMVNAYKSAGAGRVMHHSDGNVLPLLDMWIDAGIDAINPVEFRTGMDPVKIRQQYGKRLVCVGGLDNSEILPRGDRPEIRDHVLHLLEAGRGGGFIIGPHSIGEDISVETMVYVLELLETHSHLAPADRSAGAAES